MWLRALTDSDNKIKFSEDKPGVSNLLTIYATMKNISIQEAEQHFAGCGYGDLKTQTAEAVIQVLSLVRERMKELKQNREYLIEIATKGAEKARKVAQAKLKDVYTKLGLVTL